MSLNLSQMTILIVDDDEVNRDVLGERLDIAGFTRLLFAPGGQQALDLIAQQVPDLILLDVMMPDINGFEVTRRIRAAYPDRFIPIILVSALHQSQDRVRGIEAGANDFLSRPFDSDELIARINSLLALKKALDELEIERKRLALLYDVSRALSAQLNYTGLLHQIVALTTVLTGASKSVLVVLDEHGNFRERIISRAGQEPFSADTIDPLVLSQGLIGWVIQNRQPALLADVTNDPRWTRLPDDSEPEASAVAVPLVRGAQVAGALLLVSPQTAAFGDEHLNLLIAIGSQASIALENARLFEQARQQRARTEALLNQIGDPVIVTDSGGYITRINPAAHHRLRLSEEALHRHLSDVFGLALADLLLRAQERQSAVSGGYTLRGTDRESSTFNVSVSPIEQVGYLLVWQDITAIKESELVRLETERAERQRIFEALSRYMSPALVERVLSDRDILKRRERREVYVLFADLRGFTRLTVEHSPDDVMALLNDVFSEMMEIAFEHEGVIFDIAGDELMIGFNVPLSQPDASTRSLATAIAMQRRFIEVKSRWAARGMEVGMGIGINRGPVVIGHVGGRMRMQYAMVGEAVNIAHRLVEIAADGQIVVTPGVLEDNTVVFEGVTIHELPPQHFKGKAEPQPVLLLEIAGRSSQSVPLSHHG